MIGDDILSFPSSNGWILSKLDPVSEEIWCRTVWTGSILAYMYQIKTEDIPDSNTMLDVTHSFGEVV